ncbi:MAG: transcription-repair coupling factor [Candidatus Omnitrophica bacterium]|nr:transcription-repair coupling factor [Candidatus Omnitrophota bacterium]
MFDTLKLYVDQIVDERELIATLAGLGYARCKAVSAEGDFSLTGETLVIFPITYEFPVRIDMPDNRIASINSVDIGTFKTIDKHSVVIVFPVSKLRRSKFTKQATGLGEQPIDSFVDIEPGDLVVHIDHGIGKYLGVQRIRRGSAMEDHFVVEYRDSSRLFVKTSDLHKLQRYISFHRKPPELNSLKGKAWAETKKKAATGAAKTAGDLLKLQALRETTPAYAFGPDNDWQKEVEAAFPFKDTPDQAKASRDVKLDMEKPKAMDRLLCGDVGYGKTEVVLRAAFKAVMNGKQVAFLVPTTILAEQHTNTFYQRLKNYPVNIKMLNRFCTGAEQKKIIDDLAAGKIDIAIGTHRLLSGDVKFKDLGLLIVDEEQRFGVGQKNRIKRMKFNIDILTLTATPIPRTLYMALMGGKDISVIETPPVDRLPVNTELIEFDKNIIRNAIRAELARSGQVYFVHNRVDNIARLAEEIQKLVPEAKLLAGHGQMSARTLEKTMMRFIKGEVDILVSTTIIESGIDIPNANTMFINEADKFGLADLYQLRGRIGRFDRQAHAYLIVKNISTLTHEVQERLAAIKKYQELGSGFKIAMRDMEMRGAGNILGLEQSGFIDQIGFDLYCRLLREEIQTLRTGVTGDRS